MGELRLYAVGIDELRDVFSGAPEMADALRAVVADRFPPVPTAPAPGLLGKLGPLFKRPLDTPVFRPGTPSMDDLENLVAGRYVRPERLVPSWNLLEAWLDVQSWGRFDLSINEAGLNDLEFDLARAGMPSQYGLRKLFTNDLGIPLRDRPGLVTGYVKHAHAAATEEAWITAAESSELSEENRATAHRLIAWLNDLQQWATHAGEAGRPSPDVVGLFSVSDS